MKYYVIFLDDDGRLYVANKDFDSFEEAQKYADGVAQSRQPRVTMEVSPLER